MNTKPRSHRFPRENEYLDTTYYDKSTGLLDIGYQKLRELPSFNYSVLTMLMVDFNALTSLPVMPNLTYLSCQKNRLTGLPYYPKLVYLNASDNRISRLPAEYKRSKLEWVDMGSNGFTLDVLLPNCSRLYLSDNGLKAFDFSLVPQVKYLDLSDNRLTSLADHSSLLELHVQCNQLTKLGNYPRLKHLNASRNSIITMSQLPSIDTMDVSYNRLTVIHQPTLTSLIAHHNRLDKLSPHDSLTYLNVAHNKLTSIVVPSRVDSAFINGNRICSLKGELHCLAEITLDYSAYRIIYPKVSSKIVNVQDTVIPEKLNLDETSIAMLEQCKLGRHEPIIKRVAARLSKPFDVIKQMYYDALVITVNLKK